MSYGMTVNMQPILLTVLTAFCLSVSSAYRVLPDFTKEFELEEPNIRNKESEEVLIIGGSDAEPGEFPWQVSIQKDTGKKMFHFCGGSILDETHVLCASHCTIGQDASKIFVIAGAQNMKDPNETSQQRAPVKRFANHPMYNPSRITYDSSIIVLAEPLIFDEWVKPIRLAPAGHEPSGPCVNTGWGNANRLGLPFPVIIPNALQKVNMTIVSRGLCRVPFLFVNWIAASMICAGGGFLRDSCNGDSGGPLVCYDLPNDPDPYLAGIVSWGVHPCGLVFFPAVFGNVAYMREFIDRELALP